MEFIDDDTLSNLKLTSKRLKAGQVQVNFQVKSEEAGSQYGYLLAEPKTSLRDVVAQILGGYSDRVSIGQHRHLYNIGRQKQTTEMLIFK